MVLYFFFIDSHFSKKYTMHIDWESWHDIKTMLAFHNDFYNKVDILIYRRVGHRWRKSAWEPWFLFNPLQSLIHTGSVFDVDCRKWISVDKSLTCLNPHLCPHFLVNIERIDVEVTALHLLWKNSRAIWSCPSTKIMVHF